MDKNGIEIIINIMNSKPVPFLSEEGKRKAVSSMASAKSIPSSKPKKRKKKYQKNSTFPSDFPSNEDPLRSTMASPMERHSKLPKLKGDI